MAVNSLCFCVFAYLFSTSFTKASSSSLSLSTAHFFSHMCTNISFILFSCGASRKGRNCSLAEWCAASSYQLGASSTVQSGIWSATSEAS